MYSLIPFEKYTNNMDHFFDDIPRFFFTESAERPAAFRTDIQDLGDHFLLEADLPGFQKDEVQVELEDGYLTIRAEKGLDKDEKDDQGRYIRQERYAGAMSRSFYVGEGVTVDDMKAKFEDGILQISVPKTTVEALPKKNILAIE